MPITRPPQPLRTWQQRVPDEFDGESDIDTSRPRSASGRYNQEAAKRLVIKRGALTSVILLYCERLG